MDSTKKIKDKLIERRNSYDSSFVTEGVKKDLCQELKDRETKFRTNSKHVEPIHVYQYDDSYDEWKGD